MSKTKTNNKGADQNIQEFRGQLLNWYDHHARILPWRSSKGKKPDPYHVWLSEIMLQQTTVGAVQSYFLKFLDKWPRIEDLAAADQDDVMKEWAGLGYYARARNLHKCAQVVANDMGGIFPQDQKMLEALPGIGNYTSAAIRAIAFNKPATVVDGNIERIMARYFAVSEPLPKSKPKLKSLAHLFFEEYKVRPGDLAQAMMDLGATICIAKTSRCGLCPVAEHCQGRIQNIAETLPRKDKKKPRPKKFGHVYWIENEQGEVLLHRRPSKGLLGGMVALPTSEWVENTQPDRLPYITEEQDWGATPTSIHHVFTHFELELRLKRAQIGNDELSDQYFWASPPKQESSGFPSVFQKALVLFRP